MENSAILRVGLIGAGSHVRRSHVPHLLRNGCKVVAVYDPSKKSRRKLFEITGEVPVCESADKLARREDVDLVIIGTPDEYHLKHLEAVVKARKPVLCEKPLIVTVEDLEELSELFSFAQAEGIPIFSCHPRRDRHNPNLGYGWVRERVIELISLLGSLQYIRLDSSYPIPSSGWKEDRRFLPDKFVHDVDWFRDLLGDQPLLAYDLTDEEHIFHRYDVAGKIGKVTFSCIGTRLHEGEDNYTESILLRFAAGTVTVYVKTGMIHYHMHENQEEWWDSTSLLPMDETGYNRVFDGLAADLVTEVRRGRPDAAGLVDLWVNSAVVGSLVDEGVFRYAGSSAVPF